MIADRDGAAPDADLDVPAGRAPFRRVVEEIRDGALDRRRHALDDRLLQIGYEGDGGPVAPRALDCIRCDEIEPNLLGRCRLLLAASEVDQLGDQCRHLPQLLDHVLEQALALARRQRAVAGQHLDVRPQARQRRPQLV